MRNYTENEVTARLELRGLDMGSLMEGLSRKPEDRPAARAEFTRRLDALMEAPLTAMERVKAMALDAEDLAWGLEAAEERYGPGCLPLLRENHDKGRRHTDNQLRGILAKFYHDHPDPLFKMDGAAMVKEREKRWLLNEDYFETEEAFLKWAREEYGEPELWGLREGPDYLRLMQIDILESAPFGLKYDRSAK